MGPHGDTHHVRDEAASLTTSGPLLRLLVDAFWLTKDRPASLKDEPVVKRYFQGHLSKIEEGRVHAVRHLIGYEFGVALVPSHASVGLAPKLGTWEHGKVWPVLDDCLQALCDAVWHWAHRWDQRVGFLHSQGIPLTAPSTPALRVLWEHEVRASIADLSIRVAALLRLGQVSTSVADFYGRLAGPNTRSPVHIGIDLALGGAFDEREATRLLFDTEAAPQLRRVRSWLGKTRPLASTLQEVASRIAERLPPEIDANAVAGALFLGYGTRSLRLKFAGTFGDLFARDCLHHLGRYVADAWGGLDGVRKDCVHELAVSGAEAEPVRQIFDAVAGDLPSGRFVAGPDVLEALARHEPHERWRFALQHAFLRRHVVLQRELGRAGSADMDAAHAEMSRALSDGRWDEVIKMADDHLAKYPGDYVALEARGTARAAGRSTVIGAAYEDLQAASRVGGVRFFSLGLDKKGKAKVR